MLNKSELVASGSFFITSYFFIDFARSSPYGTLQIRLVQFYMLYQSHLRLDSVLYLSLIRIDEVLFPVVFISPPINRLH